MVFSVVAMLGVVTLLPRVLDVEAAGLRERKRGGRADLQPPELAEASSVPAACFFRQMRREVV